MEAGRRLVGSLGSHLCLVSVIKESNDNDDHDNFLYVSISERSPMCCEDDEQSLWQSTLFSICTFVFWRHLVTNTCFPL